MDVKVTLKPGQRGTKQLVDKFGKRLICVRYRYDRQTRKRYKTAEIIVDEQFWLPDCPRLTYDHLEPKPEPEPYTAVLVQIGYDEYQLRTEAKQRGGQWLPKERLWRMRYRDAEELGLKPRIERFAERLGAGD